MVATIIPFGSEAYFITLLSMEKYNNFLLLLFASTGNILGSVFNWICGYYVNYFIKKTWFPMNNAMIDRGNKIFNKYGKWSRLAHNRSRTNYNYNKIICCFKKKTDKTN